MDEPRQEAPRAAPEPVTAPLLNEARERSLNEDLQKLAQEARAYAQAELTYQKARAGYAAASAKTIALCVVVAAVLAFFAAMALVVGLIIALAPLITAWGSTAVVTLGLLAIAGFLVLRAKKRATLMLNALGGEGAQ